MTNSGNYSDEFLEENRSTRKKISVKSTVLEGDD